MEMNVFCKRGRLYYPPVQRPRPYSDITEVDPMTANFCKGKHWAIYRGFYDAHHVEENDKESDRWKNI